MGLTERAKFCLACDCAIFAYSAKSLQISLIERKNPPFAGQWALPGGFLEDGETLEQGAARELLEETGIDSAYLEPFGNYSQIDRDPRGRVISVGFLALVNPSHYQLVATGDAVRVKWFSVKELPPLAFDHEQIVKDALRHLRQDVLLGPTGLELLPKEFTLGSLQELHEAVFDTKFDKRNFRKKVVRMPFIIPVGKKQAGHANRPAELFCFDSTWNETDPT